MKSFVPNGKKASANMWWIIIGAVIALVVMIVLMVMFTTKSNKLEGGLGACESKGGICVTGKECPENSLPASAFECSNPTGTACCVGSPKVSTGSNCGDKGTIPSPDGTRQWCRK